MGEDVHVARAEDETSSQLEGVLSQFVLRVSGGFCASASFGIVASQEVQQVSVLEFHDIICFALFVNEQGEGNSRFIAKSAGVNAVSKPHGDQRCGALPESLLVCAQLRDMLPAKDSAVVAQEDNHGWLAEP